MILPSTPDPTPGDLGLHVLRPGTICLDGTQPLGQVDATRALLAWVLTTTGTQTDAGWWRYQAGRQGRN
jgi:hypothetical protein